MKKEHPAQRLQPLWSGAIGTIWSSGTTAEFLFFTLVGIGLQMTNFEINSYFSQWGSQSSCSTPAVVRLSAGLTSLYPPPACEGCHVVFLMVKLGLSVSPYTKLGSETSLPNPCALDVDAVVGMNFLILTPTPPKISTTNNIRDSHSSDTSPL